MFIELRKHEKNQHLYAFIALVISESFTHPNLF